MTMVGATGHQDIPTAARKLIQRDVRELLRRVDPPLQLVTALAAGADQLIATEAIDLGGSVEAVIPSDNYESTFSLPKARSEYRRLLSQAARVTTLNFSAPSEDAFWEAGKTIVNRSQILVAVWDGRAARGLGGTADVVRYAEEQGREVHVVWPAGVTRD